MAEDGPRLVSVTRDSLDRCGDAWDEVAAMKWILTLLVAAAVLALVGVSALANQRPGDADLGSKSIEIVMTEMRFSPNRIDARAGQSVLVTIVNRGSERHDLAFPSITMPDLRGVETLTMPGESTRLTLSFDAPGTYPFLCTIPGHAAAGMTGAMFVSP
ncbi:MAG: cupredoxin domain-containing protein [Candidatus Limnocylindrales bacterium]|nr:cupredoxin domain-containing protein [Candidatus Limnocylindrales bacterium]